MLEALKKRIGETGEVIDFGLSVLERKAAETADMQVPVLSQAAEILNPAYAGARAVVANVTSGGGKYYRPEVRDERHFSKAALRDLGATVEGLHGEKAGRAGGLESATRVNLANSIGGFSVRDGAVTDVFDINGRYEGVPQVMTDVARAVLGGEEAPDAGKVATRIPLTALGLDPAKIKAEQDRRDAARREQHERPFREFERFNREIERLPAAQIRTQQADRAGDPGRFKMSRNVLATDKVPKTIFGFTVVSERRDYTPEDLRFFRENPEAGGYYDLEDEGGDVVRGDVLGGDSLPDEVKSYYRDPATGRDNVPATVVKEWEAFRATHPDAKGYEWNSVEGFREPREADPGSTRTSQAASGGTSDVEAYVNRINAAVTDAIPFIKEHEGFRERAYQDSVGKWTVGYGQTEIDGRPVREGDTITEKDASAFVERRARENAVALYRQNPWMSNLSQGALSALYDVAYNLGAKALGERRSPTLNRDMQSADTDWDSIVWRELPTYVKAGGRTLKGLVNRRNDAIRKWRNQ